MTTVTAEIRQMSPDTLADLYCAGDLDVPALLAIDRADVRTARQRDRASAERAAWLDAAHAQYQQASAACNGRLLARGASVADELSLWRGSDAWAQGQASEELREWWYANGGRLSLANYRRQQAIARRAWRDERDLAAIAAAPVPERTAPERTAPSARPSARELAEAAACASRPARAPGSIARYITALGALERQADKTARVLARVNGGIRQ